MGIVISLVIGMLCGAVIVLVVFIDKQRKYIEKKRQQDAQAEKIRSTFTELKRKSDELKGRVQEFERQQKEFGQRVVSYDELRAENQQLKQDLGNIDVHQHKLHLDVEKQRSVQEDLDARVEELGSRYMKDTAKWVGSSLTTNNFVQCKQKLLDAVQRCRGIGFDVSKAEEDELVSDLKQQFEKAVRLEYQRQEQARIKAQIREEERIKREAERELKRLDQEQEVIRKALELALERTHDEHSAEVEELKAKLAEAEEKARRAVSQAQLTKAGHVYVISNIGSFGEGVFKIGMTRRLTPHDRVRELSGASVPFPFDVHMMISCDDAPALENKLHHAFQHARVNKTNPRKEFFRADVDGIRQLVEKNHGTVDYMIDPEALEYRQSMEMTEEDSSYIDEVFEEVMGEDESGTD